MQLNPLIKENLKSYNWLYLTPAEIEAVIEREVTKTKDQKVEDYINNKKVVPMIGGGPNDYLQGVM